MARRSRRGPRAGATPPGWEPELLDSTPLAPTRPRPGPSLERVEEWRGEEWLVRPITGAASTKSYRCPGCDHEIRPATPHVVAWPADAGDGLDGRRHWHTACWRARHTRGPRP